MRAGFIRQKERAVVEFSDRLSAHIKELTSRADKLNWIQLRFSLIQLNRLYSSFNSKVAVLEKLMETTPGYYFSLTAALSILQVGLWNARFLKRLLAACPLSHPLHDEIKREYKDTKEANRGLANAIFKLYFARLKDRIIHWFFIFKS